MNSCLFLGPVDPVGGLLASGLSGVGLYNGKHICNALLWLIEGSTLT